MCIGIIGISSKQYHIYNVLILIIDVFEDKIMNKKQYDSLVDIIGGIIKITNSPEDSEDIDNALKISHAIGEILGSNETNNSHKV